MVSSQKHSTNTMLRLTNLPDLTDKMDNTQITSTTPQVNFHLSHRPVLDGLRGIAVLAVTAYHFKFPLSSNGWLGVDIFFALSGFLITSLLMEEWRDSGSVNLGKFYFRRVTRLYPALLLMLIVVAPFTPAKAYIYATLTYFTNWIMALHFQPINLELGHTWSLAIEEQYYILWPLFLLILLRKFPTRKVFWIPLVLGLISAVLRAIVWIISKDYWRFYTGTDTHMDGLLLGSALGLATVSGFLPKGERTKSILPKVTIGSTLTVLLMTTLFPNSDGFYAIIGILLVVVTILLVIWTTVVWPSKWLSNILAFKPLVFFGTISYGLYLWQVPVINLLNFTNIGWSPWVDSLAKFILTMVLTMISYRYLEKPVIRLRSKWMAKFIGSPVLK